MDKIIFCEICGINEKTRVRNGKYACDYCYPEYSLFPSFHQKEFVSVNFPNELISRSKELGRRIILPEKRTDGKGESYIGRIGENGQIQDRAPDISP